MAPDRSADATALDDSLARPNVLAFAAPTTVRFLVLIGALVSTGLFLGTWTHNVSHLGVEWTQRIVQCHQAASAAPAADWLERHRLERQCQGGMERRRFAFAVGGAAATLGTGIAVTLLTPVRIERRRRLRSVDSRVAPAVDRFRDLAHDAGLAREPTLMVGPVTMRDAFSYGLPGRYRVAVPPAILVRWRDTAIFDPLVRHELAHVRHHDVELAWLARSTWMVVLPLLAIPLVGGLVRGDHSLLGPYLWRAALLTIISLLAAAALLRSREFDADLRAAQTLPPAPV